MTVPISRWGAGVLTALQAAIDALQAKLDKKTRDADNGAQSLAARFLNPFLVDIFCSASGSSAAGA